MAARGQACAPATGGELGGWSYGGDEEEGGGFMRERSHQVASAATLPVPLAATPAGELKLPQHSVAQHGSDSGGGTPRSGQARQDPGR